MLIPGTVLQGRYRIIRQIGGGGQALVYLAEDTNLGDLRAVKELTHDPNASPQERQAAYDQFQREARVLARLNHPNLARVWDHFRVGDNAYLIMDYIDGQTLQEIMEQTSGFLPEAAVLRWAGQLCDVLDYLHQQHPPVIFRDLKPSNVMLDRSDTVKLIDFGIVRHFKAGQTADTVSMGTPGYASLEQHGRGQTDARSDIYALGATLYHLVTRHEPEPAPARVLPGQPDPLQPARVHNPKVRPSTEAALAKAMAVDPVQRFRSALEMKRALTGAVRAPTPTATIPPPAARRRIEFRWLLLALAAVFVVVVWFLMGQGEPGLQPTPVPPTTVPTRERVWEKDGSVMVYVPAGEFLMGSPPGEGEDVEHPQHTIYLSEFWIDKTEVTNAQYRKCVEIGACRVPTCDWGEPTYSDSSKADHPMVCVSWQDAKAYCGWAGKRLPTEAEWEKAARGTDGRKYPWGDDFHCQRGNFNDETETSSYVVPGGEGCDGYARTAPVGSFVSGASPYGALDMAGNVREWCQDWYDADYYASSPQRDPQGPSLGEYRVARGGSWSGFEWYLRAADRFWLDPDACYGYLGFRCVS
jgi:formylglycine-generating enzyme required for sulfatase activity